MNTIDIYIYTMLIDYESTTETLEREKKYKMELICCIGNFSNKIVK